MSIYFYVDMDAFFASVEEAEHPESRGLPLASVGRSKVGVIASANYPARALGVRSAMSIQKALAIAPNLILYQGSMERYKKYSQKVMDILSSYSPDFFKMSIDEGWMDMTGMGKFYSSVKECALEIQKNIFLQAGVTCSIGIAWDLVVAKMASDYKKPNGITVVPSGQEIAFIDTCGISGLWGIGGATKAIFERYNINSTHKLRSFSIEQLQTMFGTSRGEYLYEVVRGKAGAKKEAKDRNRKEHSISIERTFDENVVSRGVIAEKIEEFSYTLFSQCIDEKIYPRTVGVKIKYAYDKFVSAQSTTSSYVRSSKELSKLALGVFDSRHTGESIRLIGIEVSNFINEAEAVSLLDFLDEDDMDIRSGKIDKVSNMFLHSGAEIKRGAVYKFD